MQSTSSSAEPGVKRQSATEALAGRYRHLFVLPRSPALVLFTILTSLILSLTIRTATWAVTSVVSAAASLLCALLVSTALRIADSRTIATFRRVDAAIVAGQVVWLVFAAIGLGASAATGGRTSLAGAALFGGFVCAGIEFLIINGGFSENTFLSACLAAVHPLATALLLYLPSTAVHSIAILAGASAMVLTAAFPIALSRLRTSQGFSTVGLFRAFMKTWAGGEPSDLESIISSHAEAAEVTTKVLRFQRDDGGIFIMLPGVHPGPFFPVGSYNLPGLVSSEFKGLGPVMTFHRPGGHERNLASNEQTRAYVTQARTFAESLQANQAGTVRGPIRKKIGKASVSSAAFGEDMILTISFAPLGSDDLEPTVENHLSSMVSEAGFSASVIDAHNSIGTTQELPDLADSGWKNLVNLLESAEVRPLKVAYAHSSEVAFSHGVDVTGEGIGLLMLESNGVRSVMILADSNNAAPSLRSEVEKALESAGYDFVELCTSDTHDLAAKGLTVARGYKALGEDTSIGLIRDMTVSLAKLAEGRLAPCTYGSGQFKSSARVLGAKALDEFAAVAQASTDFAKKYLRLAVAAVAVFFLIALII